MDIEESGDGEYFGPNPTQELDSQAERLEIVIEALQDYSDSIQSANLTLVEVIQEYESVIQHYKNVNDSYAESVRVLEAENKMLTEQLSKQNYYGFAIDLFT